VSIKIPGGTAGHTISPCHTAGCYAPGGRYPLPSSVLMTAITARVAGVTRVIVASPKPALITLGAAFVAGADALLAVGGAQAIAAMAYGTFVEARGVEWNGVEGRREGCHGPSLFLMPSSASFQVLVCIVRVYRRVYVCKNLL
jgi:hypothetical protein